MFLCHARGLSAAALGLRSTGSFLAQVNVRGLRDVTLTLRKELTFQGYQCFCGSDSSRVRPGTQESDLRPVLNREPPSARGITDWSHLNRITTVALNLSKSAQIKGANSGLIRQPLVHVKRSFGTRGEPGGHVWTWGVSSRIMQTRSSSTKKSDSASDQTADGNKEEVQNLNRTTATSPSTSQAPGEPEPAEGKPSKTQQLKKVFKEYGAVGVSFHICISLMSLGMFYLLVSSGIDMAALLCKLGFSEAVVRSKMAAGTSTFVLAYAIHKLFAPVRMSITLVSVPLIVRYFRKTGHFRPPTPGH